MDSETTEAIKRHFDVVAEELQKEIRAGDEALRFEIRDVKRHSDVIAESLRNEICAVDEGLRGVIRDGDESLRNEIRAVDEGLRGVIRDGDEGLRGEIRAGDEALGVEIRDVKRHPDVVAESLRSEIRLVAEGVAGLDEKFTLEFGKVREEIGEVKGLLVVSYRDLDRRLNP